LAHGERFDHPRLQLCEQIFVCLKAGVDLEEWKNKFQFSICPNLTRLSFFEDYEYDPDTEFPFLKLTEEDATFFTISNLNSIFSSFAVDSPVTYLACQIAKLNNINIELSVERAFDP